MVGVRVLARFVVAAALLSACGESPPKATGDAGAVDAPVDADAGAGPRLPSLEALTPGTWNAISPGGETRCADGSPYRFYVWPGSRTKLVVDFLDGGGCWDDASCVVNRWFVPNAEAADARFGPGATETPEGLYAMTHPSNPVQGYTHVVVTYCSADIHLGDAEATYASGGQTLTLQHRGAPNARAVLGWVRANFASPEVVFSTGCSAGSTGSIVWSAHLMRAFPDARHVVMSDSGAGVSPAGFIPTSLLGWNPSAAYPDWIEGFDLEGVDEMADFYALVGDEYPDSQLSKVENMHDRVQWGFYKVQFGDPGLTIESWSSLMLDSLSDISARTANFDAYVVDVDSGDQFDTHCIINKDELFVLETFDGVKNVKIADWIADMLAGTPVDDVYCPTCTP